MTGVVAPGFLLGAENLNSGLHASVVSPSPRFSDPFLALLLLLIRTYTTSRVEASVVFSLNPSGSSLLPGPVWGGAQVFLWELKPLTSQAGLFAQCGRGMSVFRAAVATVFGLLPMPTLPCWCGTVIHIEGLHQIFELVVLSVDLRCGCGQAGTR